MDLAVNLFGEEEPYGPKPPKPPTDPYSKRDENGRPIYLRFPKGSRIRGTDGKGLPSANANNPNGPPPLDWWVIDDGP